MSEVDKLGVARATREMLKAIGHPKQDPNIEETPHRVAKMFEQIFGGYHQDPNDFVKLFPSDRRDMVIVRDVPIYSYCSHHIQPFYGQLTIAYIPDGQVLGLSKLVRIARVFAKRLQLQEELTGQIADFIDNNVPNQGVAVSLRASHMCMVVRGVRAHGSETITTKVTGLFKEDPKAREEFLMSRSTRKGY